MSKRFTLTLSDSHAKMIEAVDMGSTSSEKLRNIIIGWLDNKSFISTTAKKKLKID